MHYKQKIMKKKNPIHVVTSFHLQHIHASLYCLQNHSSIGKKEQKPIKYVCVQLGWALILRLTSRNQNPKELMLQV
jgi:hypothetical protein